jgi:hypothetical protein
MNGKKRAVLHSFSDFATRSGDQIAGKSSLQMAAAERVKRILPKILN